jgi:hypothetical protein
MPAPLAPPAALLRSGAVLQRSIGADVGAVRQVARDLEASWAALPPLPALHRRRRLPLAERQVRAALRNNLGLAHWSLGNSSRALSELGEALRLDPFDGVALRNRAWVLQSADTAANADQGAINAAHEPLMDMALVRLIFHLGGGGGCGPEQKPKLAAAVEAARRGAGGGGAGGATREQRAAAKAAARAAGLGPPRSYAWLMLHLMRHFRVVEFERSAVAGAVSVFAPERLGRRFRVALVHSGDGFVRLVCTKQECATAAAAPAPAAAPPSSPSPGDEAAAAAEKAEKAAAAGCAPIAAAQLAPRPPYELAVAEVGEGAALCADPFDIGGSGAPSAPYLGLLKRMLGSQFESAYAAAVADAATPYASLAPAQKQWHMALSMPRLAALQSANIDFGPVVGHTISSVGMFNHLHAAVRRVVRRGVPGDVMETGTWRGGLTVWLKGLVRAYEAEDAAERGRVAAGGGRFVWAVDSFQGVPPPRDASTFGDDETHGWAPHLYAASLPSVRARFANFGLLDARVGFIKGYFNESLPAAVARGSGPLAGRRLAILRLDGDTYESTMDVLLVAYALLSVGGFVIIDDFHLNGCRRAVFDFRAARGIREPILPIPEDYIFACTQRRCSDETLASAVAGAAAPGGGPNGRSREVATTAPETHAEPRKPIQGAYWVVGGSGF